jgi:hypothetical protein
MLEKIIKAIKGTLSSHKQTNFIHKFYKDDYKSPKVNLGQIQSSLNSIKKISDLSEVEFQVFSQFGDDGIIQYLINELPIKNKTFIEFGVENYREANTRFLLINNYWSGLVIDGSKKNIDSIKNEQFYSFYDLQAECSFITRKNINDLIKLTKFDEEVGILSVDIDGNDYWIWKEINCIKPIILISEYNSLFGFEHPYTIEYKDDFVRGTNYRFNFYGTSLRSICDISKEKGYSFIGSNSAGNNAYFIRNDYMQYTNLKAITPKDGYKLASFSEAWNDDRVAFRGKDKLRSIHNLPVVNTQTGKLEKVDAEQIIESLSKANKLNRF